MYKISMQVNFTICKCNQFFHKYAAFLPTFACYGIVDITEFYILFCKFFIYAHVLIILYYRKLRAKEGRAGKHC